jgi:hypothetical protein
MQTNGNVHREMNEEREVGKSIWPTVGVLRELRGASKFSLTHLDQRSARFVR